MISAMRKNRKILAIVLWVVIIAFISTIFVVWGIGSNESNANYVAKVNDVTISYDEYRNAYDKNLASMKELFGENVNAKLTGSDWQLAVLDDIINQKLIIKEADRLKIPATNYDVMQAIIAIPAFQKDGYFDPETYVSVLRSSYITPAYFEDNLRNSIKIDKFNKLVVNSQSTVNQEAILSEYNYRNTKASVDYFMVAAEDFSNQVTVDADNLSAYYAQNGEVYRIPAKIKLKYMMFDKTKFADNVTVTDDEALAYYNSNLGSYTVPETFDLRTIGVMVKKTGDTPDLAAAKAKIEKAYAELKKGTKFIDVLKKYSDETFKTGDGLAKGVERSIMPQNISDALNLLKVGEFSEIIQIENGFIIVQVEKHNQAKVSAFEEVKNDIIDKLKDDRLTSAFKQYVYDLYRDILNSGNITAYIAKKTENSLTVAETGVFTPYMPSIPVLDKKPDIKNQIFNLNKTEVSQLVEDGNLYYFFEVMEKEDSFIPLIDVVMSQVTKDYKLAEAKKIGISKVSQTLKTESFEKVAAAYNAEIQTENSFLRSDIALPFGTSQNMMKAIFSAKGETVLDTAYLNGDKIFAIKVKTVTKPTMDNFETEKDGIEAYIKSAKQEEALKAYIENLRKKAKIVINPVFLESLQGR